MIRPRVHLNIGHDIAACGTLSMILTTDADAVTCPYCIAAMELQPA